MSSSKLVVYGSTSGVQQADTTNVVSSIVVRDVDGSVNVGQANVVNVVNTGTDTVSIGSVSTAAAGATTTDAAVLPAGTAKTYLVTGADGTKGVRVHTSDATTGRMIVVTNGAAAVLKIYPPTGGAINTLATDAAFSTASGKGAILVCTGAGTWAAFG